MRPDRPTVAAAILSSCLAVAAWAEIAGPDDLLRIEVVGTQIRELPSQIWVVVESREAVRGRLVSEFQGPAADCFISTSGNSFIYEEPSHFDLVPGFSPDVGDVIYIYRVPTTEKVSAFAKANGLIPTGRVAENPESVGFLYRADPRFYVLLVVMHGRYFCPMHPHVRAGEPGACPVCGMNLTAEED